MIIGILLFMIFLSVILALGEIQIEGKDGWASNLPCWRIETEFAKKLMDGNPITGYHVYTALAILSFSHLPLLFITWTWRLECLLLGFYFGVILLEDIFWFVFNPYYGLRSFRKGKIWWRKTWWGPLPSFTWVYLTLTVILFTSGNIA